MNNKVLIVQSDFDGTITVDKTSTGIKEEFGSEGWQALESEYHAGNRSVEENNVLQYALVRASENDIADYVNREVVVRDGFQEFVAHCEDWGLRFVIVSSGLDAYINPTLKKYDIENLETHSGDASFDSGGIQVKYLDPNGKAITSGFKESFVRYFKSKGHTVVYLGDGLSDVGPAKEADYVFARSDLRTNLAQQGAPHYTFETFNDVIEQIGVILKRANVQR